MGDHSSLPRGKERGGRGHRGLSDLNKTTLKPYYEPYNIIKGLNKDLRKLEIFFGSGRGEQTLTVPSGTNTVL